MSSDDIPGGHNKTLSHIERSVEPWSEVDSDRMHEDFMKQKETDQLVHWTKHQNPDMYRDSPLLRKWLIHVANPMQTLTESEPFNLFVIGVIMTAGIIVGLQTDKWVETLVFISVIDNIILAIFTFEVVAKILAEGFTPLRYWVGPEWKWNCFDFIIVLMSFPNPILSGGGMVKLLRLVRLARLAKLIRKIPQLQMIIMGLFGGFKSIGYIMLLLFIVLYLFGIIGIMLFGANDPWHFGTLRDAIITLFRASTLEDWTDIMYINFFGCDGIQYDSGIYHLNSMGRSGIYHEDGCPVMCHGRDDPNQGIEVGIDNTTGRGHGVVFRRNPWNIGVRFGGVGMLYWHVFILLSALVMLSLFIGAVTMSMTDSMDEMQREAAEAAKAKKRKKEEKKRKAREEKKRKKLESRAQSRASEGKSRRLTSRSLAAEVKDIEAEIHEEESLARKQTRDIFRKTWNEELQMEQLIDFHSEAAQKKGPIVFYYYKLSLVAKKIAESPAFVNFITAVICVAGFMVGVQTETNEGDPRFASCKTDCGGRPTVTNFTGAVVNYPTQTKGSDIDCVMKWEVALACPTECLEKSDFLLFMENTDAAILVIFTFEVVVKIIGKYNKPVKYFWENGAMDRWNCFDFFIVVGSLIPSEQGGMLVILRLLRLLRVLKLLKAFPELQVIVSALISGISSISYIALILLLVFFGFGVFAMILFAENDPWHFGTLPNAIYSLFRASTLEDWTDIMYTNMYGCANYGAFVMCEDVGQKNCSARMDDPADLTVFHELYCCCREKSTASVWGGFIFFFIFTVIGALVLMTLFIGVITTAMEEAQKEQRDEKEREANEIKMILNSGFEESLIEKYRLIFDLIDEDKTGIIEEDELKETLQHAGLNADMDSVYSEILGSPIDEEKKEITFVLFIELMKVLKRKEEGAPNALDVVEGEENGNDERGSEDVEKGPNDVGEGLPALPSTNSGSLSE